MMIFGPLVAFRILFGMTPEDYAIYYNGPVLISFFVLLLAIAIPGADFHDWRCSAKRKMVCLRSCLRLGDTVRDSELLLI